MGCNLNWNDCKWGDARPLTALYKGDLLLWPKKIYNSESYNTIPNYIAFPFYEYNKEFKFNVNPRITSIIFDDISQQLYNTNFNQTTQILKISSKDQITNSYIQNICTSHPINNVKGRTVIGTCVFYFSDGTSKIVYLPQIYTRMYQGILTTANITATIQGNNFSGVLNSYSTTAKNLFVSATSGVSDSLRAGSTATAPTMNTDEWHNTLPLFVGMTVIREFNNFTYSPYKSTYSNKGGVANISLINASKNALSGAVVSSPVSTSDLTTVTNGGSYTITNNITSINSTSKPYDMYYEFFISYGKTVYSNLSYDFDILIDGFSVLDKSI